jgi:hypothetical protein
MGSSLGPRKDLASALDRVALVLIGVYLVLFIAAIIPPHIKDPRWLTEILDALRGLAFLPLIGGVLILLANQMDRQSNIIGKHRKWVRKFAPLAALGFFLMIPLQGLASYRVLGESRGEAMQKIYKLTRATEMIRNAQDETALRLGINAVGIRNVPQGKLVVPLATVKEQILGQLAPQILKLQNETNKSYNRALQSLVFQWLRDSALAFLYGFGFSGLTKPGEMVANNLGVGHEMTRRLEEGEGDEDLLVP